MKVGNELILQTVDIITPIVEDPFTFGQISATNALSDIYAMGGIPISALNIAGFPVDCLELNILEEIFKGGLSKIEEANALLVGGHTITDKEIKYGLSVIGVKGKNLYHNALCKDNLDIIITKPLGGGILSTALKAEMIEENHKLDMIRWMTRLNKYSAEIADEFGIVTMTDITGFGFLGHLIEVMKASNISAKVFRDKIPFMDGFDLYISYGLIPAGAYRNKEYVQQNVEGDGEFILKLSVPETSGGLLIFCSKDKSEDLVYKLKERGDVCSTIVGETIERREKLVYIF